MKILKRIFFIVYLLFVGMNVSTVNAAQVVNVEYIHKLITQTWQIDVPYFLENARMVANMEYLLKVVDRANEILNGRETSSYGTDTRYATKRAVDTVATLKAIEELIAFEPVFFIKTTSNTSSFRVSISAPGKYVIDWGDGNEEEFIKTDTGSMQYSHSYNVSGTYTVGIGGRAVSYSSGVAAISFNGNKNVAGISGSLGKIFSTLPDGSVPSFYQTFYNCTNMTGSIPKELFSGVEGAPIVNMFYSTFGNCSGLTGNIPEGLFAGIKGAPANSMFARTFYGCKGLTGISSALFAGIKGKPANNMFDFTFYKCSGLTGSIPEGLFGNISGSPADFMFRQTFYGCSNLSGDIPEGLFGNLVGTPKQYMFEYTFYNCSGLTGIPLGLFGELSNSTASWMFRGAFYGCSGLRGPSARMPDGTFLYDYLNISTTTAVQGMYTGATGLDDYPCLPTSWGGLGRFCGGTDFYVTTTPDTSSFRLSISAAGNFKIDWGDGNVDYITRESGWSSKSYSHTYDTPGEYIIGIGGETTDYYYNSYYNTTAAAISFYENTNVAKISGGLGKLFPTLADGSQPSFSSTFKGCTNLTGNIPEDLFTGIVGAPAEEMFKSTFEGCAGLTGEIPENLFEGISGAPKEYMFNYTFRNCSGLTGSIPEGLFAGIKGSPATYMFRGVFSGCSGLTGSIPAGLFAGINGSPASYMFSSAFYGCSGLTGNIPEGLFAGIKGSPATYMFSSAFYGCSGLTGNIPEGLFAGIKGSPATYMFSSVFSGCSGLTGSIPTGLFGEISGTPVYSMFQQSFYNCSGLTGEIPLGLFGNFTSKTPQQNMFREAFYGCSGLTGPSARLSDGTYLYDYFDTATSTHVSGMYTGATGLEDYPCIPKAWGGAGGVCTPKSSFYITTTSSTSSFSFKISAAGEYTIDWGDGNIDEITKTDTTTKTYSHTYARSGEYIIGLGGKATLYNSNTTTAAVSFNANKNIAKISGSLGEVFSTLANGGQPRFYQTFYNCTNIKGNIPENLFSGIAGKPVSNMFDNTFYGCSGFTGEIPENLFAELKGAPQPFVFYRVFEGCSGLTGEIPGNLFAGIQGVPAQSMFYSAFANCSGLTKIPENLFAGIQGKPAQQMFQSTFWGCSGISEIPENLFAGLQGEPAYGMFQTTFHLSGIESIPANLFAGIYGQPATFMFNGTFHTCPKLKTIEGPLFSRINGAPADFMYQATFEGCTELSGEIPLGMFGTFTSNTAMTNMFVNAFYNCNKLTGPSARMPDGTYLYNYFNTASSAARDMYYNCTGLSDYSSIPRAWK